VGTNDAESPAYISFIGATNRTVIGKFKIPEASNGIEQPAYDTTNKLFYISVPATTAYPGGAIYVFSPQNGTLLRSVATPSCNAHGIAVIAPGVLALGCSSDQLKFNLSQSYIFDVLNNKTLATLKGISGNDQVTYSRNQGVVFFAAYQNVNGTTATSPSSPTFAIVNATDYSVIQTIAPTDSLAKNVGADDLSDTVGFATTKGIVLYKRDATTATAKSG